MPLRWFFPFYSRPSCRWSPVPPQPYLDKLSTTPDDQDGEQHFTITHPSPVPPRPRVAGIQHDQQPTPLNGPNLDQSRQCAPRPTPALSLGRAMRTGERYFRYSPRLEAPVLWRTYKRAKRVRCCVVTCCTISALLLPMSWLLPEELGKLL